MQHNLKTTKEDHIKLLTRAKNYMILKDEGYKKGDWLLLQEYENEQYTNRGVIRKIVCVDRTCNGLNKGYCAVEFRNY